MPQHIVQLVLLIVLAAGAAYAAKRYFTVDTFYQYGRYQRRFRRRDCV